MLTVHLEVFFLTLWNCEIGDFYLQGEGGLQTISQKCRLCVCVCGSEAVVFLERQKDNRFTEARRLRFYGEGRGESQVQLVGRSRLR